MSDSSTNPIPSAPAREEAISLAQSEKTDPKVLEELPAQFPDDEEIWRLLLSNPETPLGAMIYIAERASESIVAEVVEDRVFLLHNPVVGQALLKNPTLTEADRRKVQAVLQETTKEERERKKTLFVMIKEMSPGQKIALAKKGNKEARMILVKDANEMIALEAVNSPRITEEEIISIAQMRDVSDKVLRAIANNRRYRVNKSIVRSLFHNPRTPVGVSLGLGIQNLSDRELRELIRDRNIPAAIPKAAKAVLDRRKQGSKPGGGH